GARSLRTPEKSSMGDLRCHKIVGSAALRRDNHVHNIYSAKMPSGRHAPAGTPRVALAQVALILRRPRLTARVVRLGRSGLRAIARRSPVLAASRREPTDQSSKRFGAALCRGVRQTGPMSGRCESWSPGTRWWKKG